MRSLGDIKIKGNYEYQNKSYFFYKELEPLKGRKNKDFYAVKENKNITVKIKVDPLKPQDYVLLFE
jgi:hypothetical protein